MTGLNSVQSYYFVLFECKTHGISEAYHVNSEACQQTGKETLFFF